MAFRIGWLTPFTPATGVGTFSRAVTEAFPDVFEGEPIDLTVLHPPHESPYDSRHRTVTIEDTPTFHQVLSLFDILIYNVGNNTEHHEAIFNLLRLHPGVVICHDYVYQHYLAGRGLRGHRSFAGYAALITRYAGAAAAECIKRSRITSRTGQVRYTPWDSDRTAQLPMSEPIVDLSSAVVVHSAFMEAHVRPLFDGPVLRLGMPSGQKTSDRADGETKRNRPAGASERWPLKLMTFGYIQPAKCIDLVLDAIAGSEDLKGNVRFTVAGHADDGHYLAELRRLTSSLGLDEVVSFQTDVSETRLQSLMAEADIFINLRRPNTEGSSASLVEQLDTGRPVIVLNSGCYAEVPTGAAIKLPGGASSHDLRRALEAMAGNPDCLSRIGEAGRDYARRWTCEGYAESIVRFAAGHRRFLMWRGKLTAIASRPQPTGEHAPTWIAHLARARLALRALDGLPLMLDPELVLGSGREELVRYLAHVVFGIFDDDRLELSLDAYVARGPRAAIYWRCVLLNLIARAVFATDPVAQRRLAVLGCGDDPLLWDVVEHLPMRCFLTAAMLMLTGEGPHADDLASCADDDADGFPKRLRLVSMMKPGSIAHPAIRSWLDCACLPLRENPKPSLNADVDWPIGAEEFGASVDLCGFHRLEPEHVWARGRHGFVGLRLDGMAERVEVLVRHLDASASRPCRITLALGEATTSIEARSPQPIWVGLDVPVPAVVPAATSWCLISAERAAVPPGSSDPRVLGIALIRLCVTVRKPPCLLQVAADPLAPARTAA